MAAVAAALVAPGPSATSNPEVQALYIRLSLDREKKALLEKTINSGYAPSSRSLNVKPAYTCGRVRDHVLTLLLGRLPPSPPHHIRTHIKIWYDVHAGGQFQGHKCSLEQLQLMAKKVRPLLLTDCSRKEAQLDRLEPGFLVRQAALEKQQRNRKPATFSAQAATMFVRLKEKFDKLKQKAGTLPGG